ESPPGAGDRLCRLDRSVDRRAPALRNSDQRPLCRSDEGQAAARAGAGGSVAYRLRPRAHSARHLDDPRHAVALRADALTAHARSQSFRYRPSLVVWSGGSGKIAVEGEPLLPGRDHHLLAVLDTTGENELGERILHRFLDHALERAGAIGGVVTFL